MPGIDGLLQAAPAASKDSGGLAAVANLAPEGLGSLVSLAGPFRKSGLPPEMAAKFVPLITNYVRSRGGASVAELLGGAFN